MSGLCSLCCGASRRGPAPKGRHLSPGSRGGSTKQGKGSYGSSSWLLENSSGGSHHGQQEHGSSVEGTSDGGAERKCPTRQILEELEGRAEQLSCMCLKYPKGGAGGLRLVGHRQHERYIAVVPERQSADEAAGRPPPSKQDATAALQMWLNGKLAYWESEDSFLKNKECKGFIELLKIAKVSWDKDCPTGLKVTVKHKQGSEFCELVLRFSSKREAEEWSYGLWDFISRLRKACQL